MNLKIQIFSLVIAVLFMGFIVRIVRFNRLGERDSIHWVLGSLVAIIIAFKPGLLDNLSFLAGVEYPPALLFLVALAFLFVVVFIQTIKISELREKNKELAQAFSLMQADFREKKQENSRET